MATYLPFLAFATLLAVTPGPDTLLTLRTSVVGGRSQGLVTAAGVSVAGTMQGLAAATGLGAVLAASAPAFLAIRWAGVAYLTWLGLHALRDAARRDGSVWAVGGSATRTSRLSAFRRGFVCNITNPKVLAFNLAVLPQFVGDGQGIATLVLYAMTLVVMGTVALVIVVRLGSIAAGHLARTRVRRSVDGATGVVFLGFATALALDA